MWILGALSVFISYAASLEYPKFRVRTVVLARTMPRLRTGILQDLQWERGRVFI